MSEELNPCPFCGSLYPEKIMFCDDIIGWEYILLCRFCGAKITSLADMDDAIRKWNTRHAEDVLKAEVERLREALTQIGIVMLYSEDEKADEIFKLCEEKVGDSLKKAYVEKLQEDIEKMGLNPDTGKGGEDE